MKRLLTLILGLSLILILSACTKSVEFILIGDEIVHYTTNTAYTELGYLAKDEYEDISANVTILGNVNPTVSGDYLVTYTLEYGGKTYELERLVYYREAGCQVIEGTNITECQTIWTQYLHTYVKLKLYYEDNTYHDQIEYIFENVETILEDYHQFSDKYNNYDGITNVKTINDNPTETHTINQKLFDLIQFSLDHQDDVDQRFNIALGPVLSVWHDYREACNTFTNPVCEVPTMPELEAMDQYTDPDDIIMNATNRTITMSNNMSIDLGGVSKGYISGKIIEYLDSLAFSGYLLNNGESNISIGGTHPTRENEKFLLAISDPSFTYDWYALVYIGDSDQLVTSGDYQQYYTVDDEIYHHIINPSTLMPDHHVRSVSIITSDPALADLYSTAIFTMTLPEGLLFVNNIDGLEAIWYTVDDELVFSENFEELYLHETR